MRDDFFAGHQEAYLSDLVRILYYTGKVFNMRDVLVMALDEKVLNEQIGVAQRRIDSLPSISMTMRLNFEMSVKMIRKSLADRERIAKIQGLLNELLAFLEDDLSIVTGAYQNMLTIEEVVDKGLILVISLNSNKNKRASEALGKILLQNIRLMVGRRYQKMLSSNLKEQPILSVICDEIARYADPDFPQVLQTARGARVSFLFSFQAVPQLENVSRAFAEEVCSAPGTKMIMNGTDESTAQWFLKASSRVLRKRRSLAQKQAPAMRAIFGRHAPVKSTSRTCQSASSRS
jgi:type IV secretory pathway TraG/TraD family ATPase VirD4